METRTKIQHQQTQKHPGSLWGTYIPIIHIWIRVRCWLDSALLSFLSDIDLFVVLLIMKALLKWSYCCSLWSALSPSRLIRVPLHPQQPADWFLLWAPGLRPLSLQGRSLSTAPPTPALWAPHRMETQRWDRHIFPQREQLFCLQDSFPTISTMMIPWYNDGHTMIGIYMDLQRIV